jgi:hypothetical protein
MDDWGFDHLLTWSEPRVELPVGALFCVIDGSTRGRAWSATAARAEFAVSLLRPESVAGPRRISCVTRTRVSWHGRACR